MAGDWIKMRVDLQYDPAVIRISAAVGINTHTVVGALHCAWAWANQQTTDGRVPGLDEAFIDRLVGTPGFGRAMIDAGWLSVEKESPQLSPTLVFPDFDLHNGASGKARIFKNQRQARWRAKQSDRDRDPIPDSVKKYVRKRDGDKCVYCGFEPSRRPPAGVRCDAEIVFDHVFPASLGGGSSRRNIVCSCSVCNGLKSEKLLSEIGFELKFASQDCLSDVSGMSTRGREEREKRRGGGEPPLTPEPAQPRLAVFALPSWVPTDAWKGFEEMRRKIKKPMTDRAKDLVVAALDKLRTAGQDPGRVLDQSTRKSWQDVYPIKDDGAVGPGGLESRNATAAAAFARREKP